MTAVPYPADTRAKGWRFEIDTERIRQSDTWALAPAETRPWLLMLWMVAWEQTPCGSMPNDDVLIAARLGLTPKVFAKQRAVLMRGWWLAEDGRLYHPTLTARVLEMMDRRRADSERKGLFDAKFKRIRDRDGRACVYCCATTYLSLDHLVAVSRGGSGDDSNLVIACRSCNSKKGARTPDEAGLSFANPAAAALWDAILNGSDGVGNASVTREERVSDATDHRPPSTTEAIASVDGGAAQSAPPPIPPPAFDGLNAEVLNCKAIVPLASGWELPEPWGNDAISLGWRPNEVLHQAERFRQYWTVGRGHGKRRSVKGWRQSWSNWIAKAEGMQR